MFVMDTNSCNMVIVKNLHFFVWMIIIVVNSLCRVKGVWCHLSEISSSSLLNKKNDVKKSSFFPVDPTREVKKKKERLLL